MELIIIAAMATNRIIGCQNAIPWQIPEDMAHFKASTMGSPVIMGRRTYQSIDGPLPGRLTIVVSGDPCFRPHHNCLLAASLTEAIACCAGADKAFVAGGGQLYQAALPLAQTLILTVIGRNYAGDVSFPDFSAYPFVLASSRVLPASLPLIITTYRRQEHRIDGVVKT